ncbi:MAG: VOC family protein [Bacteroidia bacterium]
MENRSKDKTPKVLGVGGIFFFCNDPKETREWYAKNLGMDVSQWGAKFESRDMENPEQINALAWSPFKSGSNYFAPSKKDFMINYRVQNIEGLVDQLKKNGVTVVDDIEASEYGKFVHIMDADGNKIELWEE